MAARVEGSLATEAAALVAGVGMVRVHDVLASVRAARLVGPVPRREVELEGVSR